MIILDNEFLKVILSEKGAELQSIVEKRIEKEYLWQGDPKYWHRRAPVLFPIVGSLKNDTYIYEEKQYELGRHGFVRDAVFQVTQSDRYSCTLETMETEETLKHYPFRFLLRITYELSKNRIRTSYEVLNRDNVPMLFSLGAHPAFSCDIVGGDYVLEFEQNETLVSLAMNRDNGLLTRETYEVPTEDSSSGTTILPLHFDLFARDTLIFEQLKSKSVLLRKRTETKGIKIIFDTFPHLGLWTPNAPFLCIEPWYGHADYEDSNQRLSEKEGIIQIAKGELFQAHYDIEIDGQIM